MPPIGKQKHYPALDLTVLHAQERDAPPQRQPLEWKAHHDLPFARRPTPSRRSTVRHALEDRDLPQNLEVRLPRGGTHGEKPLIG